MISALSIAMAAACSDGKSRHGDIAAQLDSLFGSMFADDAPGALVTVMSGDSIIYSRGFGMADLGSGERISDSTVFNICSVSKQFSAIALLKLQEQGLLSLDDSVDSVFPEFPSPLFGRITFRQLLSHTSGLPDIRPRTADEWARYAPADTSGFDNVEDYKHFSSEPDALAMFMCVDSLAFEPGTAYEYQNPTYQLVYYIVERLMEQDFDSWMRDNILAPAGMESSVYFHPGLNLPHMAHGYRLADNVWLEDDYGEANYFPTKADGGLYTTAGDFMRWQKALYDDRIVSAASRAEAHTPLIATDEAHTAYGLGFFIEDKPGMPRKIYHTGDNGGFFIYECAIPDRDVSYLIFANRQGWDRLEAAEKVDSILRENGLI